MEFDGFDWDEGNWEKCQKHGILVSDIESVFNGAVVILPDHQNSMNERRFRAIGRTSNKRVAFVVFTMRNIGGANLVRPLSARYMHKEEIAGYEKNYPDI